MNEIPSNLARIAGRSFHGSGLRDRAKIHDTRHHLLVSDNLQDHEYALGQLDRRLGMTGATPRDPHSPEGRMRLADADRLSRFDLTPADIEQILRRGEAGAATATSAHPVGARGVLRWLETVAALRGMLLARRWELDNDMNVSRIISPDRTVALVASAGDGVTGLFGYGRQPRTAQPRGEGTRKSLYASLGMDPLELLGLPTEVDDDPTELWILLYRRTRPGRMDESSVIRAEISRPCRMNARGYVDEWLDRIPAGEVPVLDHAVRSDDDDDEGSGEVDFEVTPKQL